MGIETVTRYHIPTEVIFGLGSLRLLGGEARKLGIRKALWVTDPGPKSAGVLEQGFASLSEAGVEVVTFDQVPPDPTTQVVTQAALLARERGCDGVIASGGGSGLGAGKATALLASASSNDIRDFVGKQVLPHSPLPCIAIPTTAGSGAEVSRFATAITDERTRTKLGILFFSARTAFLDPLVLKTVPISQAVSSGVDAWCHAIEALCATRSTPLTDAIALRAITIISENLPSSILGDDIDAKAQMLLASSMANMACGNAGLGLSHAINSPLTSFYLKHGYPYVSYGDLHAIFLPIELEYNLPDCEAKLASMARAIGLGEKGESAGPLARRAVDRVKEVLVAIGAPRRLPWESVPDEQLTELARGVPPMTGGNFANPRAPTEGELVALFKEAIQGW